jgi:8-oxo-dGTP diphosphatase
MASIYIFHGDKVLFIKKTSSRIFSHQNTVLWCGIGGHFENEELNNPKDCVLRELFEETSLKESDIKDLTLKYITLRKKDNEIRQQYIYFANLSNINAVLSECDEGELHWINTGDIFNLDMSITNTECLKHYFQTCKNDNFIYAGTVKSEDNTPEIIFTKLQDFDTAY